MRTRPGITMLIALFSFLLTLPVFGSPTETVTGVLFDAVSGEPVHGAHIYFEGAGNGVTSNPAGEFTIALPGISSVLIISHVAYRQEQIQASGENLKSPFFIRMQPARLDSDELIVSAGRFEQAWSGIYNTAKTRPVEDHMSAISGLDMVTRANFAKDPVIRGLRDGRVNVLVDGMRLTPACVDGMDPATAYVESDNLQAIEISRGQEAQPLASTAPGGSVNFAMARPVLNSGFTGSAETGYHTVSSQRLIQSSASYGSEQWGFRLSGTYRKAGDLMAGNHSRISGSGLEKGNILTSLLFSPNDKHEFSLRYIGDFAGKIGYPKLIMDTRQAVAHIAGLEHTWSQPSGWINSITTNMYVNRVEHWMDDYDRDVTQRDVMPGMFMPMYGETLTTGITSSLNASTGRHLLNLKLDAWRADAFADMRMEHLSPDISDMFIVNLGDVSQWSTSLAGSYRYFTESGWILGINGQAESGVSQIRDQRAIAIYRAEYPGIETLEPGDAGYLAGLSAEKQISEMFRSGVRLSDGRRLPDHMERYGYYVYQPADGFFYYGNPALETERSSQAELFLNFGTDKSRFSGSTSVWINRMDNYIAGNRTDDMFKRYENMGIAVLTGFETDLNVRFAAQWMAGTSASWVFGRHNELNEPLPMIPPLKGSFTVQRGSERVSAESRLRWAASQNRIAEQNSRETRTESYALWDFYARVAVTQAITLQTGFENILNTFYTDHLSVNSMPGAGRNVHVSLRVSF